jgi:GxxExxY protein
LHHQEHEEHEGKTGKYRHIETGKQQAMQFDRLSNRVIGCAIEVHRALGPGLLESTYEHCLAHELESKGIPFKVRWPLPVEYKSTRLDCGYRVDMLIEDSLILELKAVE